MSIRTILHFFLVLSLAAGTQGFADEESSRTQIQQWIQQLGDESFLLRQRAESLLIRAGIQAYPDLQRAKQSRDVEVAQRAEAILSQIEQTFLDSENRSIAFWVQQYMTAPSSALKAQIIWILANPTLDLNNGEGVSMLCRLVRFEGNAALRLEAAKSLIASPPFLPAQRKKWYRYIQDNLHDPGDDELLQCVAQYAKLWCALDAANEKTTPAFQEQVRQVSAETLRLLEKPENGILPGSGVDILLRYAVAELQDAAGLNEDRDKVVSAALAVQADTTRETELTLFVGLDDELPINEHFYVGQCLRWRYRFHWALPHFQKVIETGHVLVRVEASEEAAKIALYLADYSSAASFFGKRIEILQSPDYKGSNTAQLVPLAQRQKAYCLAEKASAEENWTAASEAVLQALAVSNARIAVDDIDLVILAHRICKQRSDVDQEFRDKAGQILKQVWQSIVDDYNRVPELRVEKLPGTCNSAAWLLANTDGDFQSALTLVEAALKAAPDDPSILDTLAHVYFLGGKFDEAIRVQEDVVRAAPEAVVFHRALERFKRAQADE